jgi:RNA polymerase sigma-70 factor (ECF subfamily)
MLLALDGRLVRLAQRMLKAFPNVQRWAESDDVLQRASLRLLRTLEQIRPTSTRDFFNLAAVHIRRELLDLARTFHGPLGVGANHGSVPPQAAGHPVEAAPDLRDDSEDLDRWAAFHMAVEALPIEQREVISLAFYHGWTHERIAALLQITDRTVRRYWAAACVALAQQLSGRLPNLAGPGD